MEYGLMQAKTTEIHLNYPWTTAALCCSNSPDLNENKIKETQILYCAVQYDVEYTTTSTTIILLISLHYTVAKLRFLLYSLVHIMLRIKKIYILLYNLEEPF